MSTINVLIVDDSSLMRQMISELFETDSQFSIPDTACNGLEGLDKINATQPDLVIMDVEMPEMDGLSALKHIMTYYPVPVVMLSSYTTEGSSQTLEAMQLGAVDFFHKDMLFNTPPNRCLTEDFLLRCKVAVNSKGYQLPAHSYSHSIDAAVKVLVDSINYCMKIEEELRVAQEELRSTLLQQSGLVLKFKQEQQRVEDRMKYLANHDQLTGLPNRRQMSLLLGDMFLLPEFAVLYVDLDNFKLVNDTLGHSIGDQILQIIARRLKRFAVGGRTVIRVGGDEFILLTDECSYEQIVDMAERIMAEVGKPIQIQDHVVHVTASIGISRCPEDAGDAESLLKFADMATYSAKEQGRKNYRYYSPELNERLLKRMELEIGLRRALELQQFILDYQAVVDVRSGQVIGMESLVRWVTPELGRVSPQDFIPIAEETGLIHEIGAWVLEEACRQNKAWQSAGLPPVTIAVNLSSKQFYDPNLTHTIVQILQQTQLDPQYLELEITETMTMAVDVALPVLHELKRLGVKIAIDDFGTGYSSLSYLKKFPIDKLKIDQSFVRGIVHDEVDAAIVNTIISMADYLKLEVVAEGVENEEVLALLKSFGCGLVQGYLFSPPVDARAAENLLGKKYPNM